MVLSYSTEAKLAIKNINASPFNVGQEARLDPFSIDQIRELGELHGLELIESQIEKLRSYLGGQPYLIRKALFALANHEYDFETMLKASISDQGPFSDHLRHHLFNVREFPELAEALKLIIQSGKCKDPQDAIRLSATGLVAGTPPDKIEMACELYREYFRNKLG